MSASTVIDGRAIQAQFANLTEERDRYYRETDEAKAALQTTESKISAQRSTQTILNQQIQVRSNVLGRSDRDVQLLRTRLEQLRRQHTSEAAETKEVTSKLDAIEGRIVESQTTYFAQLDGLNDELDAAMNRYDEGRIVRHLTVGSIADGLLPRIRTMIESERMKMTTAEDDGNDGGNDEENVLMELEAIGAGTGGGEGGGGGGATDDRAQKLQDLSDQIAASLGQLREATNRLGVATRMREQTQKEIDQLRSTMMQGRNRDGRVFTELDLNELETKWTEDANLHPQEDDPASMGAGGGGSSGGGGGTVPNLSSSTANLDLFYNAASQEEDMPPMMEEGHDGHVGDGGMVAMEAAKTVADGGAGGGSMTMMQQ